MAESHYVQAIQSGHADARPFLFLLRIDAAMKHDRTSIERPLADLYRRFARPELAVPLYESVLAKHRDDEAARDGLEAARWGLLEPEM